MDYKQPNLTILDMVFARARFLDKDDVPTQEMVKNFIWEVMGELNSCFRKSGDDLGDDANYTITEKAIIANLVMVYIILFISALNAQGSSTIPAVNRFLKRAKAGTAEVEWGELSSKNGIALFVPSQNLIDYYGKLAQRAADQLGCIIDLQPEPNAGMNIVPFLIVGECGGCSGSTGYLSNDAMSENVLVKVGTNGATLETYKIDGKEVTAVAMDTQYYLQGVGFIQAKDGAGNWLNSITLINGGSFYDGQTIQLVF